MNKKSVLFSIIMYLILSLLALHAQESVLAAGTSLSGSGGSVSYSIGQIACQTNTGTIGSVAEGVQQPFEISVVTAVERATGINLLISVYPNPTLDYVTLSINEFNISNLSYQLYDMQGKLLHSEKITGNHTKIVISHLMIATYFVVIREANKEVKKFKIIKN